MRNLCRLAGRVGRRGRVNILCRRVDVGMGVSIGDGRTGQAGWLLAIRW